MKKEIEDIGNNISRKEKEKNTPMQEKVAEESSLSLIKSYNRYCLIITLSLIAYSISVDVDLNSN